MMTFYWVCNSVLFIHLKASHQYIICGKSIILKKYLSTKCHYSVCSESPLKRTLSQADSSTLIRPPSQTPVSTLKQTQYFYIPVSGQFPQAIACVASAFQFSRRTRTEPLATQATQATANNFKVYESVLTSQRFIALFFKAPVSEGLNESTSIILNTLSFGYVRFKLRNF